MTFTFVDALSVIPGIRLSSCHLCGTPHSDDKIRKTQDMLNSLPLPPSFHSLMPQLRLIAKKLLCPSHEHCVVEHALWMFAEVDFRSTAAKLDIAGAYPDDDELTLDPYLQRKRDVVSGQHGNSCGSCGKSFRKGTTVYSTICGHYVCNLKCAEEIQPWSCRHLSFCTECSGGFWWEWTFGESDPYVQYNLWKPYLNLRIEHNGDVVFDEQYSSSRRLWPLLAEVCDYLRLDPASMRIYQNDDQVDKFQTLDTVRASSSLLCF